MILIDTSAWIEFLRDTGSPVCHEVDRLLDTDIATTDPIVMEVLAGARDDSHLRQLRALLARTELKPCQAGDYTTAAGLYRQCRQQGETIRRLIDCLIAAVAIRSDLPVLHQDVDYDVLGHHAGLKLHPPRRA